ncbi:MAG: ornithine--oxo-acid transaminase [Gammaproteobacteria bacterium RIFCSPHIGHO2_12_FULL_35_23]|nr:MAG: ornithine--oxo-acid transaminase [Gammaproteobacteria bacterium RIFCSPHIGHO2_12_FULL_35_23]
MMDYVKLEQQYGAHNYKPLPVVLVKGEGVYVWDNRGKRYIDMMSAYSAVSLGHSHPKIVDVLIEQAKTLNIVSRAYYTDKLGPFLKRICEVTGQDMALPMNTGAEAVETALKAARKWGHKVKGIADNKAEIIACEGNFHGRTIAIVGMSSEPQYKDGFGPFPEGLKRIPYGDAAALEKAITPNTAAFLVEPIQGEAGINVPPVGYLKHCAEICKKHNVLLICDEVQTGLGRTGKLFAYQYENIQPDGLILGKALGGGILPVSMFLAKKEVMNVFTPGDHGSTFGGNALSSAVGLAAIDAILEEKLSERSAELGHHFAEELRKIKHPAIVEIRGFGLFIGIEINPDYCTARDICLKLLEVGLLSKETHDTVVRLAPPLVITKEQIEAALTMIRTVFTKIPATVSA